MIPDALRVDHRDGSVGADAQAIHLAAVDEWLGPDQFEFLQSLFEKFPRLDGLLSRSALRIALVGAQEEMSAIGLEAERLSCLCQCFRDFRHAA